MIFCWFYSELDRGEIIPSNKEGVTRLCPKVGGVPSVNELRPITLLNCDYKLLSKWLVSKVRPKLPSIIKSGQLCSVNGKNILFGVSNVLSSILEVKSQKSQACIISLDFFKAYDRVFLDFLLKVMLKMNFGKSFISWVAMLHEGATTRFILGFLTRAIEVRFSIRQGDPFAMILYIIYVEPLLVAIERNLHGLRFPRLLNTSLTAQILEAYCDDVNIITNSLDDLKKLGGIIGSFERYSGAILSRDNKCKVMGLGKWSNKLDWPISWLQVVDSLKIFGIFIARTYSETLQLNWDFRFNKFRSVIMAWSSRNFESLQQRIEVVKVFGLSRVYFVASILPIRRKMVEKFESVIGNFIWAKRGNNLRVALKELMNQESAGGLGLPCLSTMNKALLTSQTVRLLKSGDIKSISHIDFWMGNLVSNIVPHLGQNKVANETPEHFAILGDCFAPLMMDGVLTPLTLRTVTNRIIYKHFAKFRQPKIINDHPNVDYHIVWKRLNSPTIRLCNRDTMFLLIHNKLAVPERLHRTGFRDQPYCSYCPGNVISNVEHYFCQCLRTRRCWSLVKQLIGNASQTVCSSSDWTLVNLAFPRNHNEQEITCLIYEYVRYAWLELIQHGVELPVDKFFGYLTFKFKGSQVGRTFKIG